MAHNLSIISGKTEMFYVNDEKPWHGLGTPVEHALTAKEAIEVAHLDWTVEKREIFFKLNDFFSGEEKYEKAPGFATIRTDENIPLGIVSENYQIIQNHQAFEFIDALVASNDAKFITAGALFQGKRIWASAKLPGNIIVTEDDVVDKYLLLTTGHDGVNSVKVLFTPIRVVCMNTLNQALSSATTKVHIRHTGNIKTKVLEAQRILGIAIDYFEQIGNAFKVFAGRELTDAEFQTYIGDLIPGTSKRSENIKNKIEELYFTGIGSEMSGTSLWGAYNAVTEYVDHHRIDWNKRPDKYLASITYGTGAEIKTKAYQKAIELVS
jgi:phage/plasmid-like protein (TIGR03299 family)